jgi:gluconolactonase
MDRRGRLFVAAGLNRPNPPFETADRWRGGIYVLNDRGRLLQFVPIPNDEVTNCALGGEGANTLFVTAGGHLWSVPIDGFISKLQPNRSSRGAHLRLTPPSR